MGKTNIMITTSMVIPSTNLTKALKTLCLYAAYELWILLRSLGLISLVFDYCYLFRCSLTIVFVKLNYKLVIGQSEVLWRFCYSITKVLICRFSASFFSLISSKFLIKFTCWILQSIQSKVMEILIFRFGDITFYRFKLF